jgi:hypothetical protein
MVVRHHCAHARSNHQNLKDRHHRQPLVTQDQTDERLGENHHAQSGGNRAQANHADDRCHLRSQIGLPTGQSRIAGKGGAIDGSAQLGRGEASDIAADREQAKGGRT